MLVCVSGLVIGSCRQSGAVLPVCLIFLTVMTLLVLGAMENQLSNQKMTAALQAQAIAFYSAEAGLLAEETQINGGNVDLSNIQAELDDHITADALDDCQQHIFTIVAHATYQHAQVKLQSAYLLARQPPLPGCPDNQPSHRLWWRQVDIE